MLPNLGTMIHSDTLKIAWIEKVAQANRNADKILVEKAVRALYLLEQLQLSKLEFILKGGTALLLLLPEPKRLSIDLDVIVSEKPADKESFFKNVIEQTDYLEFGEDERETKSRIKKEHYKFYYEPVTNIKVEREYILLDVLYDQSPYGRYTEKIGIQSSFLKNTGILVKASVPTYEAILGDKLTAFAPNTTGVPYGKDKEIEIIKQLYDIGNLFDHVRSMIAVRNVFKRSARMGLSYREMDEGPITDVLEDILQTSLCIATRGKDGEGDFRELQRGIQNIRSFIFSESFHLEKAMVPAAKAAYLSALVRTGTTDIRKFTSPAEIAEWKIESPFTTRLNRFKKTNPEAFFYWYQTVQLDRQFSKSQRQT